LRTVRIVSHTICNTMLKRAIPTQEKRGRPRSRRTEMAILRAANELITSGGLADLTMEGVAERAGVGKASIYRRWPSKGALAFDAVVGSILATQPTPDTGSLEGDLRQTARSWVRSANNPRGARTVAGLIAEVQSDPDLAKVWRERFVSRIRQERRPIIERAIARGEIPVGSDPEMILDLLYGPLYHRYLNGHLALTDSFAKELAHMVAAAAANGG
jgi:AcrR family transcriptional regulator